MRTKRIQATPEVFSGSSLFASLTVHKIYSSTHGRVGQLESDARYQVCSRAGAGKQAISPVFSDVVPASD
jgi:hypothetical protein